MLSPSPTQQPPTPEAKPPVSTPRKRPGQSPAALMVKKIFRPIIKGIYYCIEAIKRYKIVTIAAVLLFLISIITTTYFSTGQLPFGVGNDPFNFHVHGSNGGGDTVKNWLYALRDGDTTKLALVQAGLVMPQPPDPNQLVAQFSEGKAHVQWRSINVIGAYSQSDTTVDSFISVDIIGPGPGGNVHGVMIWHFTTLPQTGGRLLYVDLVAFRPSLAQ